ncbi:hypothetical protein [Haloferax profundi]|uniref:Uncharacterized protein n=1 Tax=Haloferax profundi TaxID=1544718 RepID=A0A0W1SUY3_9EURY|nr:hypothetical protein [Haloferax profundi]KTG30222.1 hypothetical protein AUR66_08860 [Haloferax profundi]
MNALKNLHKAGKPPRIAYRGVSTILGVVTLVTFGAERFLYETAGQSLGELPAYVMGGVLLVVGVSAYYASVNGQDIRTAILLSLGPVGGLLVYLIGYHLVLPPSTDSPTWLLFLAFAGGLLAIGTVAHICGRLIKRAF